MLDENATQKSVFKDMSTLPSTQLDSIMDQVTIINSGCKIDEKLNLMLIVEALVSVVELKKLIKHQAKQIRSLKMVCETFARENP